jgi:hypothetical protein
MAFSIIFLRGAKWVGHTTWTSEISPPCKYVRDNIQIHEADTAIITDENGRHLAIAERQKFDA